MLKGNFTFWLCVSLCSKSVSINTISGLAAAVQDVGRVWEGGPGLVWPRYRLCPAWGGGGVHQASSGKNITKSEYKYYKITIYHIISRISLHKTGNIPCPCKISKLQFSYFPLQPFSYFIVHIHNLVGLLTHDSTNSHESKCK